MSSVSYALRAAALIATIVGPSLAVGAQEYAPGDKVVVLEDGEIQMLGRTVDTAWRGLTLDVQAVNGDYLRVKNLFPGWLPKSKVMPLDRSAADRLTELIQREPQNAQLYNGRAQIRSALGETDAAIADHNEAIRLEPSSGNYSDRGNTWTKQREYDKAIQDYNEALRLAPKNAAVYNNRGYAHHAKGDDDKAIEDFNEAMRINPQLSLGYISRAAVRHEKKEYDEALQDYNEALRLDPYDADTYLSRGWVWYDKREYRKAIEDFSQTLRINPKDVYGYASRMAAWQALHAYDNAIKDCSQAIELAPKDVKLYLERGRYWRCKGEIDKAISDYNAALQIDPKNERGYGLRGFAWHCQHEYDKAIADYRTAIELDPKSTVNYTNLAFLLATARDEKVRNAELALEMAEKSLTVDASRSYAISAKACALALQGDFEAAIALEKKALEDAAFAEDTAIDGGVHAPARINCWRTEKLWLDSMVDNPNQQ